MFKPLNIFCLFLFIFVNVFTAWSTPPAESSKKLQKKAQKILREQILTQAAWALQQQPVTVTSSVSPRSAGTKHDFFSEGDYWWPDPNNPGGPYLQKDGMTNPENFVDHRLAIIRFSRIVGSLTSAYKITGDEKYVRHALLHLKAWFTDPDTRMNPSLLYAQAIMGRHTGRGIGIIDTIHLMEVAQGVMVMQKAKAFNPSDLAAIKNWFAQYLTWLTTHPYGQDEMNAANNHGNCWVMQVGAFARLTQNEEILNFCRDRYKKVLLPNQMAPDGSFPLELRRTKPYGYSLFNLDAMAMVCQILSTRSDNLWEYLTSDGRSIKKGIEYLHPFVQDKSQWPHKQDVMYWENWPIAHPFHLLGAIQYSNKNWFVTWQKLDHNPQVEEVIRNLPIRNPVIWFD